MILGKMKIKSDRLCRQILHNISYSYLLFNKAKCLKSVECIRIVKSRLIIQHFVFPDGALLSVGPDGPSVVGQVDAGLVALSQSPDEELFLIVTEAASLILMTRDFDPLTEIPLDPIDPNFRGEQVNVL
jgi:hypothetical protein